MSSNESIITVVVFVYTSPQKSSRKACAALWFEFGNKILWSASGETLLYIMKFRTFVAFSDLESADDSTLTWRVNQPGISSSPPGTVASASPVPLVSA